MYNLSLHVKFSVPKFLTVQVDPLSEVQRAELLELLTERKKDLFSYNIFWNAKLLGIYLCMQLYKYYKNSRYINLLKTRLMTNSIAVSVKRNTSFSRNFLMSAMLFYSFSMPQIKLLEI